MARSRGYQEEGYPNSVREYWFARPIDLERDRADTKEAYFQNIREQRLNLSLFSEYVF